MHACGCVCVWHTKVHTTNKSQTLRQPEKQRQQEHQYTCTRVTVVSGNYINIYISKQHTHTHTPTHTLTLTHTVTRAAYAGSCCCCVLSALRSTTCYMHRATRRMSNKCRKQKRWNAESKPSTRMDNICVSACGCGGRGWRERVRYTCVRTLRERTECVDEVEVLNKT